MKIRYFFGTILIIAVLSMIIPIMAASNRKTLEYADLEEDNLFIVCDNESDINFEDIPYEASQDFDDMIKDANILIIAHYSGDLDFSNEAFFYTFEVKHVLKGEVVSKNITVVDEVMLMDKFEGFKYVDFGQGISPLEAGNDYLISIREFPNPLQIKLHEIFENAYLLNSNSRYDCYNLTADNQNFVFPDLLWNIEEPFYLKDIKKNTQIFTSSQEELDKYNRERQKAIEYVKEYLG